MSIRNQLTANFILRSSLVLALALAACSPVQAQPAHEKKMMDGKKMENCQEMKEQKEKMMAEMKADSAELTAQVAKMNSAPEDKKLDLVAAIVTHLVEQRTAMHERMEMMHEKMMKHMMRHMQMGHDSMAQCPMMKDMDEKSGDAQKAPK